MKKCSRFFAQFKKDSKFNVNDIVNSYSIKKKLGEGRYGITYLGENADYEQVTVKQLKRGMLSLSLEKAKYEPEILQKLNNVECNYFPKFIGEFNIDKKQGYILEYIKGKTFVEMLCNDGKAFNKDEIYQIALKLLNAIKVLEDRNIVHKDIRITNVICTEENDIKIIDFGLARYVDSKRYKKEVDYWYIADFLIHLHYSNIRDGLVESLFKKERPWYEELDLTDNERCILMSMMGIGKKKYKSVDEIKLDIESLIEKGITV